MGLRRDKKCTKYATILCVYVMRQVETRQKIAVKWTFYGVILQKIHNSQEIHQPHRDQAWSHFRTQSGPPGPNKLAGVGLAGTAPAYRKGGGTSPSQDQAMGVTTWFCRVNWPNRPTDRARSAARLGHRDPHAAARSGTDLTRVPGHGAWLPEDRKGHSPTPQGPDQNMAKWAK